MKRHENPLIFMGGSVRGPQEKTLCILRHLRRAAAMNRVVNITGLFHFFPVKLITIAKVKWVKLSKSELSIVYNCGILNGEYNFVGEFLLKLNFIKNWPT